MNRGAEGIRPAARRGTSQIAGQASNAGADCFDFCDPGLHATRRLGEKLSRNRVCNDRLPRRTRCRPCPCTSPTRRAWWRCWAGCRPRRPGFLDALAASTGAGAGDCAAARRWRHHRRGARPGRGRADALVLRRPGSGPAGRQQLAAGGSRRPCRPGGARLVPGRLPLHPLQAAEAGAGATGAAARDRGAVQAADAGWRVRDLINTPPNLLGPAELAAAVRDAGSSRHGAALHA